MLAQIGDPRLEVYVITHIIVSWISVKSHPNHPWELEARGKECRNYFDDPEAVFILR
ncbi:hypothetical protein B0H16DRAFT_1711074 [Mycena metata]|uniref:Uncharacterized protein n=1 Tax=Mycena metata TaxID=1033252 RepID=A0AAD7NXH1_9AGAR|nr:hypothetical protein B0H16DRAFT_1711074 [Mycena metata]